MIFSAPINKTLDGIHAGFDRLVNELNRFHRPPSLWPVFADDAAAANGKLKLGEPYVTPDGFMKRRIV